MRAGLELSYQNQRPPYDARGDLDGGRVTLELTPYDLTKGRVNFRHNAYQVPARAPFRRRR